MTRKSKVASLDPKSPVVTPGINPDVHPVVKPPSTRKPKRKPRSDKGKKRVPRQTSEKKTRELGLSPEAAKLKKAYHPFDEKRISENWMMQVWPCWNNFEKYELLFVFDGVRYGYKQRFDDASLAVTVGSQYLDHRYKNKGLYVS